MRIAMLCCHVCPEAPLGSRYAGGLSVYVRSLAREVARLGHPVDIFTRTHDGHGTDPVTLAPGVRLLHTDAGPDTPDDHERATARFAANAAAHAQREGLAYDLVHSHYWVSGCAGIPLAEAWGAPHAVTFHTLARGKLLTHAHTTDVPGRDAAEERIVREATAIVVSDAHEAELLAQLYAAPRDAIAVLPPGVDTDSFHPQGRAAARRRLGLEGMRVLLCVGRLDPLKRWDVAIAAAAALRGDWPVMLCLVGGGGADSPEGTQLHALAQRHGLADGVRFVGPVPHADLPEHYRAADVLLMPSDYESFGLAALEAMACGTPVVASRVGGLAALVRDGETGYLVDVHDPARYAARVETLLANPALHAAMSAAARRRAEELAWPAAAQRYIAFARTLIPSV